MDLELDWAMIQAFRCRANLPQKTSLRAALASTLLAVGIPFSAGSASGAVDRVSATSGQCQLYYDNEDTRVTSNVLTAFEERGHQVIAQQGLFAQGLRNLIPLMTDPAKFVLNVKPDGHLQLLVTIGPATAKGWRPISLPVDASLPEHQTSCSSLMAHTRYLSALRAVNLSAGRYLLGTEAPSDWSWGELFILNEYTLELSEGRTP